MPFRPALTCTAALALIAGHAAAQPASLADGAQLREHDIERLNWLDESAGVALRQAFATGAPADLRVLSEALRGEALPLEKAVAALPGNWKCQMIKVGGNLPVVVYPPFECVAGGDGSFKKVTGSQRTTGRQDIWNGLPIYVGTAYVADATPVPYADLPDGPNPPDAGTVSAEVGVIEMTGPNAGRIMLPAPYVESLFNILVLRR